LDPHSAFLDSKTFERLQESTTGNYGGLGIEIGTEEGLIKVVTPIDDTPAAKAGILPGDLIVQIEGQSIRSMGVSEAVEIMRGAPGSTVTLSVVRQGESNPIEITLTREVINIASVRQRLLEPYFGYIRVAQFQADTGSEVAAAIEKLESETPLKGLIIDLRNNPGGVLQAAVALSDLFIREGLIVYTEGRLENAAMKYRASESSVLEGVPLVVLVNEGSASASEIVAGALQDHGRAIIMGTRTFGKGSVQTVLQLTSDKAIKLTTALYFTPLGRSIQAEGIVPDLWIDRSTVTKIKSNPFRLKEKDLPGHLNAPTTGDASEDDSTQPEESFANDFQLREALTLLKGINILSNKDKSIDRL
jgi:carboxyl-terminal processing protease